MLKEKRFLPKQRLDAETRESLSGKLKQALFSHQRIIFAYIFGSFIREEAFRDIDLAIFINGETGFELESDLSMQLSEAVGFDVEVRALNDAPLSFQMAVLRAGKVLFSHDENERTDFIERTGQKYREVIHFRNLFLEIAGRKNVLAPES
jgi:predicted nucleotidyltransferase